MEPVLREKCQVAWFKLAEFINRGEKERALTIYKLLMHTVDQRAYAQHLEADLLFFFNDPAAIDSYKAAAQLYCAERNIAQAVAIYERLARLYLERPEFLARLVVLYQELGHPVRTFVGIQQLIELFVVAQKIDSIRQAIADVSMFVSKIDCGRLYQTLLLALMHVHYEDHTFMVTVAQSVLVCFASTDELKNDFFRELSILDAQFAQSLFK